MKNTAQKLRQMAKGSNRQNAVEQGFYDGRFANKIIPSKKLYKRNKQKLEF